MQDSAGGAGKTCDYGRVVYTRAWLGHTYRTYVIGKHRGRQCCSMQMAPGSLDTRPRFAYRCTEGHAGRTRMLHTVSQRTRSDYAAAATTQRNVHEIQQNEYKTVRTVKTYVADMDMDVCKSMTVLALFTASLVYA